MYARLLAAAIRRLREEQGLSREELAEKAGMHPNTIVQAETGETRNPAIETIAKIAHGLGLKTYQLCAYAESNATRKAAIVETLRASSWRTAKKITDEELTELERCPIDECLGPHPTDEALSHVVEARRLSK